MELQTGNVETTGKNGSLATFMPDFRTWQKGKVLFTVSGEVKVCLAKTTARSEREVLPIIGHVYLVFTDIRNSTQL